MDVVIYAKWDHLRYENFFYICSWTAKKYNPSCMAMYQRLKGKGKPERVIKIAIANKILRQAFAMGKNKTSFQENIA